MHRALAPRLASATAVTLSAVAAISAMGGASAQPAPPEAAAQAVCRPVFWVEGLQFSAGTAFALRSPRDPARTWIVTAHHLFGPSGGLPTDVPAADMAVRASLDSCSAVTSGPDRPGGPALVVRDAARLSSQNLPFRDMAVFDAGPTDPALPVPLALATVPPVLGETVYLVAELVQPVSARRLHRATVVDAGPDYLAYQFDDRSLMIRATSGAPVVNAAGEVVGINAGGGADGDVVIGFATGLQSIRQLVATMP